MSHPPHTAPSPAAPTTSNARPRPGTRGALGLAVAVAAWTVLSWGGRVALLGQAGAALGDVLRIGGSLVLGAAVTWSLWRGSAWHRPVALVFAAWSAGVWLRALVTAWIDPPSTGFALVHTALALGWFALAWLVARSGPLVRPRA